MNNKTIIRKSTSELSPDFFSGMTIIKYLTYVRIFSVISLLALAGLSCRFFAVPPYCLPIASKNGISRKIC